MEVSFICNTCLKLVFVNLSDDGILECPECGGLSLEWAESDLSAFRCG